MNYTLKAKRIALLLLVIGSTAALAQEKQESLIAYRSETTTKNKVSPLGRDAIYVISPQGGKPTEVLGGFYGSYDPFMIRWIPGKNMLVSSLDLPTAPRMGMGVFPKIWVARSDKLDFYNAAGTSTSEFDVSPDGRLVAYVDYEPQGGSQIRVSPLAGSARPKGTESFWKVWEPCWSPDNRTVVFRGGLRKDDEYVSGSSGLYSLDSKTGETKKLCEEYSFPQFLPGGDSLLVMDYVFPAGAKKIHRLDLASAKTTVLVSGAAPLRPALTSDGSRIAYIRAAKDIKTSDRIAVVPISGKDPLDLARGGWPTWSPDGKRLAYERDGFIFVLEIATKQERKLVKGRFPSWSR